MSWLEEILIYTLIDVSYTWVSTATLLALFIGLGLLRAILQLRTMTRKQQQTASVDGYWASLHLRDRAR